MSLISTAPSIRPSAGANRLRFSVWVSAALVGLMVLVFGPLVWLFSQTGAQKLDVRYVIDGRDIRIHTGDDGRWSQPDWDDDTWLEASWNSAAQQRGIYWLRFKIDHRASERSLPSGGRITTARPYELYWDGHYITRNGTPGRSLQEEQPGRIDAFFTLPPEATAPGVHVVTMRLSGFRDRFRDGSPMFFKLDDPANLSSWRYGNALCPAGATGIFGFLSLASSALWALAMRRKTLLWLAGLGFAGTVMHGLLLFRWVHGYPGPWHFPVTLAIYASSGLLAWCFAGFVAEYTGAKQARWLLAGLIPLLAISGYLAPSDQLVACDWMLLTAYAVSLVPLLAACRRKRSDAFLVLCGMALSTACFLIDALPLDYSMQFAPALAAAVATILLQIRSEHHEAQKARLTAARLEIELLKKSLQPHFLMNTLTALAQTIEENPASAVKVIDDLAEEFRTLSAMSGEREITLGRELALCRTHLRLMQARTDIDWELVTEQIDENWRVPPALFLTLIENGFSHQKLCGNAATFSLRAEAVADGIRYTFHSPGEVAAAADRAAGGTGLRYIRARLDESFPGAWSLAQRVAAAGWETVIEMRRPPTGATQV